jgi:prophage regulatory protein
MSFAEKAESKVLRCPQVQQRTGLSRSTLYSLFASNQFPRPIKLTSRSVGWLSSDVDEWISSRKSTASSKVYSSASIGEDR